MVLLKKSGPSSIRKPKFSLAKTHGPSRPKRKKNHVKKTIYIIKYQIKCQGKLQESSKLESVSRFVRRDKNVLDKPVSLSLQNIGLLFGASLQLEVSNRIARKEERKGSGYAEKGGGGKKKGPLRFLFAGTNQHTVRR